MKIILTKSTFLPRVNLSRKLKALFIHPRTERRNPDAIFSLACQRCAGFTTRPPKRKAEDY